MIPVSLPEPLVAAFLRLAIKPLLGDPFPVQVQRVALRVAGELSMPPFGTGWKAHALDGIPGYMASPRAGAGVHGKGSSADPDAPVVLHFHGGAFVAGSPRTHRGMAGYLAKYTGGDVYLPHYSLAPEHRYPTARLEALRTYRALLAQGVDPALLFISGDSAGGAMVLDLAIDIRDAGLPQPAGVIAVSPGLRLDAEHPKGHGATDVFVRTGWTKTAMKAYGRSAADPEHTALGRDFSGLPPFLIQYGVSEYLAGDSLLLIDELRDADVPVLVYPQHGAFHVLVTIVGNLSRAREAARQIADFALANVGVRGAAAVETVDLRDASPNAHPAA